MPTLKTMMKRNEGLVGHVSVAEALEMDADDVAEWADGAQLPCVDGVRVFMAEDVAELELQLDGDDGDEEIDLVDHAHHGANGAAEDDADQEYPGAAEFDDDAADVLVDAVDDDPDDDGDEHADDE